MVLGDFNMDGIDLTSRSTDGPAGIRAVFRAQCDAGDCPSGAVDVYSAVHDWTIDDRDARFDAATLNCKGVTLVDCEHFAPSDTGRRIDYIWTADVQTEWGTGAFSPESASTKPLTAFELGFDCDTIFLSDHKLLEASIVYLAF